MVFIIENDLNECRKRFVTQSVMDSHKRREHAVSALPTTRVPTVCPPIHRCLHNGCGLEFAGEYTLNAHQRAVHKDPTPVMSCETNGVGSDSAVGLGAGPTRTAYRTVHACGKCNMIFVTGSALNSHRRTRHSRTDKQGVHSASAAIKLYVCAHNGCGKSFAKAEGLSKHRTSVHQKVSGQYRCECCAKRFYTKYSLDKHRLSVHPMATTRVLQAPIETEVNVPSVAMETTVPEFIPIAPTTVQPVTHDCRPSHRYCHTTATTESNDNSSDSEVEVMDVLPAYKRLLRVRPITGHKSMPTIDLSDTSSDDNSGHQSVDSQPEVMVICHYSDSFYTCDIDGCGQQFEKYKQLIRHQMSVHSISPPKSLTCEKCGNSFVNTHGLRQHKWFKNH